jgi:hypothetical protein
VRRDINGLITAVCASAIMHKAQRGVDGGRIVATLDDYRHAYSAFAPGLGSIYKPQASPGVVALVRVLETMIEAERVRIDAEIAVFQAAKPNDPLPYDLHFDGCVSATREQLIRALGIASRDTVSDRIVRALAAEAIEIVNPGAARTVARRFRVKINSAPLAAGGSGDAAFPSPEAVEAMMNDRARRFSPATLAASSMLR